MIQNFVSNIFNFRPKDNKNNADEIETRSNIKRIALGRIVVL